MTKHQQLGAMGEILVAKKCVCPKCKIPRTLKRLPTNFKCADIICDFCGFLAQVKTSNQKDITKPPKGCPGAAWKPREARLKRGFRFHLFLVLFDGKTKSIFSLPAERQLLKMFEKRKPLSPTARRAGWQGTQLNFSVLPSGSFERLL